MVLTKAGEHPIPYVDEVMRSQEKLCSLGHDSCILSQKKTAESNKNDPAIPFNENLLFMDNSSLIKMYKPPSHSAPRRFR